MRYRSFKPVLAYLAVECPLRYVEFFGSGLAAASIAFESFRYGDPLGVFESTGLLGNGRRAVIRWLYLLGLHRSGVVEGRIIVGWSSEMG